MPGQNKLTLELKWESIDGDTNYITDVIYCGRSIWDSVDQESDDITEMSSEAKHTQIHLTKLYAINPHFLPDGYFNQIYINWRRNFIELLDGDTPLIMTFMPEPEQSPTGAKIEF